jgi:hypothetical protein
MKLRTLLNGIKFDIYAIVLDDGMCPSFDFLESLKNTDLASHKSFVNIFRQHADSGPLLNEKKSKVLNDRKNLIEFRTKSGDRIMYFYAPGRKTILTHGFHKGAPESQEYDRAERMRDRYLKEH